MSPASSTYNSPACLAVSAGRIFLNVVECFGQERVPVATYLGEYRTWPLAVAQGDFGVVGYPRDLRTGKVKSTG